MMSKKQDKSWTFQDICPKAVLFAKKNPKKQDNLQKVGGVATQKQGVLRKIEKSRTICKKQDVQQPWIFYSYSATSGTNGNFRKSTKNSILENSERHTTLHTLYLQDFEIRSKRLYGTRFFEITFVEGRKLPNNLKSYDSQNTSFQYIPPTTGSKFHTRMLYN